MTIDEAGRHRLHESLDHALGEDDAAVLMEHLPPTGWADVATRHDLDHLRTALELKIDATTADLRTELSGEIAGLRADMYKLFNRFLLQLLGAMAGLLTVFFMLTQLAS